MPSIRVRPRAAERIERMREKRQATKRTLSRFEGGDGFFKGLSKKEREVMRCFASGMSIAPHGGHLRKADIRQVRGPFPRRSRGDLCPIHHPPASRRVAYSRDKTWAGHTPMYHRALEATPLRKRLTTCLRGREVGTWSAIRNIRQWHGGTCRA